MERKKHHIPLRNASETSRGDSVTGFTMIEILVVIIIIGILAGMALPNYMRTKERSLGKEAIANLKLIGAAERIYRMETANQTYTACSCNTNGSGANQCENPTTGCNTLLRLSLVSRPDSWAYRVDNVSGSGSTAAFRAVADRQGSGGLLDCSYTYTNNDDEPIGSSCP